MDKPQVLEHAQQLMNFTVNECKWVPTTTKLVVLGSIPNSNGILQIYELDDGKLKRIKQNICQNAFKCATFGASSLCNLHMTTGNRRGQIKVLDLERLDVPVYTASAHEGSINAIDTIGDKQIVTGGQDGAVRVWDIRLSGKPVAQMLAGTNKFDQLNPVKRDCWAVAVGNNYNKLDCCIAAGYDNGDLKLFDLRAMALHWETSLKNGVCSIEFDCSDKPMNKMGVVTHDGGLLIYDMRTRHANKGFTSYERRNADRSLSVPSFISGAKANWIIRHLPQNRDLFATCGDSGILRLWCYRNPEKNHQGGGDGSQVGVVGSLHLLNATDISAQPVCCLDFHPNRLGLAVCGSFDRTVRVLVCTKLK